MAAVFHIFAATVIYDIGRDGVGFTPVAIALAWIALAIVVAVAGWRRRPPGWPVPGGVGVWLALALWHGGALATLDAGLSAPLPVTARHAVVTVPR